VRLPSPVAVGGLARLLGADPVVFAEARWRDLDLAAGDDPATGVQSASGVLKVRGWTDGYDAATDAILRVGAWPAVRVRATARGDTTHAALAGIRADGWGGQVTGSGDLDWQDGIAGVFRLEGRGLDPAVLDPRATGRLGFTAVVQLAGADEFRLSVPAASGTLLGRPFAAAGIVTRRAGVLAFDDVRVRAGPNRAELNGTLGGNSGTAIGGRFRVDAPDLAALWPGYAGALTASGRFGGTTAQPTLEGQAAGRNLEANGLRVGSLAASGGLGARQAVRLTLGAEGIRAGDRAIGNLALEVSGPLTDHRLALDLGGGDVAIDLDAGGSWRAGVLTETISRATVTLTGEQRWTLASPATVRVAAPDYRLSAHCWSAGAAGLCVTDSRYGPGGFAGGADLTRFPLGELARWLPADLAVDGTADLAVTAEGDPARLDRTLRGSLRGKLAGAVITWRVPDDEPVSTTVREFSVAADVADGVLDFRGTIAGDYGLALATAGRVTDVLGDAPGIQATINGGIPDLAAVGPVVESLVDIGDLQGRVVVDVTLAGSARQPDILGGVELADGAFTVPVAGIRIDRIGIALDGRPDGKLDLKGNARSGKGYVALEGALAWRDQLVPGAEATVKGRVFDVINLPEGLVQVSPDARVVLRDGQFRVSGTMLVPRADIRLKKIAEGAVSPSPDTIVHGRDLAVVEKSPPLFVLDGLQVRLGERVTFEGFGLKTTLTGGLRLGQSLAAEPGLVTGDGVISLKEGQFTAFGQKLGIDRGSLIFSGVVTDPGIDVKASREVDYEGREVVVGVLLSGNVSRIQTRVFSEPAMGELDALSYLTTGKPLSAAGAGDRSLVASSAISLGLSQALPVVQQLGSALNVDEVSFDTTDTGGTAVVVGEQLGKNLFIRYSYGIFDKLGTVQATYKLGRRVSIEGSSGTEQSLDLVYSVTW
jgi:translocation and assembly module TamB